MGKRFLFVVVGILAFLSVATVAICQIDRKVKDDLYAQIELYSYALTTIQADYVEEKTPKDLIYGSLRGMLSSLDPHSQFLDPDEYAELKTETQGKFGGLGIEIAIRDGLLTIITPLDDTPAWRAGIKAGDHIVKIENELTRDLTLNDAVKKLRGKPGSEVKITVLREGADKLIDFTIVREIIQIQDVKNTQILEDHIGYIRLTEFREDSAISFRKALDELTRQGAESLILDLRNNPGGLLNVAINITEEFLAQGKTIVSTKGRRLSQNTITRSANKTHLIHWPMVVLINEGSASGSEILAGALQDNKRAITLGTKSFGKGSVQSVIPLPDGSGLRLTTSKYFTPSGRSIHGIGIEPDIVVEPQAPPEEDKAEKEKNNVDKIFENVPAQKAPEPEEPKLPDKEAEIRGRLLKDNQVQSAISVLKGIKVYADFTQGALAPAADAPAGADNSVQPTEAAPQK
ncbi:MAG: S41 family peptidase [Candidatus Omnitrophica bacterium]|nr:S41 family peptidase [Candidatus Omnitrophota bacterium]MBI5024042.1 S41 family peptidase [Candidatus Omnitrophota bacterium]